MQIQPTQKAKWLICGYVGYETAGSSDTVVSKQQQGSYAMVGYYGDQPRPSQETPRT